MAVVTPFYVTITQDNVTQAVTQDAGTRVRSFRLERLHGLRLPHPAPAPGPDVVPLDHLVEGRRLDVQQLGGLFLHAAGGLQRGLDVAALVADDDLAEVDALGRNRDVRDVEDGVRAD